MLNGRTYTSSGYGRALLMPSGVPITTVDAAIALPPAYSRCGARQGRFHAVNDLLFNEVRSMPMNWSVVSMKAFTAAKLYPANATTNSGMAWRSVDAIMPVLGGWKNSECHCWSTVR